MNHAQARLPSRTAMLRAMLERDSAYDGTFYTAVRTTGIFCRPTCPARKPNAENVDFYASATDALAAGFRPCRRCKPLETSDAAPEWVRALLAAVEAEPARRWTDEFIGELGVEPVRLRRWFKQHFGMTFHAYLRTRRLGLALGTLTEGGSIDATALDHGYESVSGFRDAFQKTFGATPGQSRDVKCLLFSRISTPLGPMIAMAEDRGLVLLEYTDRLALPREIEELRRRHGFAVAPGQNSHLRQVEEELGKYFAGHLRDFGVPTCMPGGRFETSVWSLLRTLPYGTTCSYGELATRLGRSNASRAVGVANGRNRIAIVVPCHRVIGADGSLCGYGGGLARKRWLLDHERLSDCRLAQSSLDFAD